jgi:hypothetical protein
MNYKKTGHKQILDGQRTIQYLSGFKQPMRSNEDCNKILDENKILEGDSQEIIDTKLANLRTLYAEENQKAGVNYFIAEFNKFILNEFQTKI